MRKLYIFIYVLFGSSALFAQSRSEQIFAVTDRQCYMTGEVLCVRVDAFASDSMPAASKVAYVELSDQRQMYAQAMVTLKDGQGWAEIPLPKQMHSGCYELTAFTRDMTNFGSNCYFRTLVGVVNGEKISRKDKVTFLPFSRYALEKDEASRFLGQAIFRPGDQITIDLKDSELRGCAVSVEKISLTTHLGQGSLSTPSEHRLAGLDVQELEGHIVKAELVADSVGQVYEPRLALIGKMATLYDGQKQPDGTYTFYTTDMNGNLPTLVSAYDWYGKPIEMRLKSPYQRNTSAQSLPNLVVYSDETEIKERATAARQQAAVSEYLSADTLRHSIGFYNNKPDYYYDLDEYTQMNSIEEILIEFVRGVKRSKSGGVSKLYTLNPETRTTSNWPALVLLDGMPVYDIDEILAYDSHLVRYVQIYLGRYFFGASCCEGVISFVTRGGRLSNYKLDVGSRLISYGFPQDHPTYINHTGNVRSTLLWQPCVEAESLSFKAPSVSGRYLVTIQGLDHNRKPYRYQSEFFVK